MQKITLYLKKTFTLGPQKHFVQSKWGNMQFCNTNTFEGTAKIDFVYFSISCSEFVISIKNANMEK